MIAIHLLVSLSLCLGLPAEGASQGLSRRPNVIWIVADDLGPQLGCYGTPGVSTPNIDRLAAEGVRFTRAFSTSPVCSTSRSAFIAGVSQTATGCHQHRTIDKPSLPQRIRPLPVVLEDGGVACFNGNHDLSKPGKTDYNFTVRDGPLYRGSDWRKADDAAFFGQVQIYQPHRTFPRDTNPARQVALEAPPWLPDHPVVRADEAGYLQAVEVLDQKVGWVLEQLDKAGLADDTVVIFVGDHGRPQVRGKQWLYDAGIHVPLVIRWPGVVEPGSVDESLVSLLDLAPTTCAIMGIAPPESMTGRVLVGDSAAGPPEAIFAARDRCDETVDAIRAVRTADLKYIRNLMPGRPWMQVNAYKDRQYPVRALLRVLDAQGDLDGPASDWMASERPPEELYDLAVDPHELRNLAAEPEFADQLAGMRRQLDDWMERCGDPGATAEADTTLAQAQARAAAGRARARNRFGIDPSDDPVAWLEHSRSTLLPGQGDGWQPLLVPGSFKGWHVLPGGTWNWEGEVLVGHTEKSEPRHGLLVSDLVFGDFQVELEFKASQGCSGFYFRVEELDGRLGVAGFQAEIDVSPETGGLYETAGRGWVRKPDPARMASLYRPGEWTTMRVTVVGGEIEVRLNGEVTARLRDDPGRREGRFAFQLHGSADVDVAFRHARIRRVPAGVLP